jgi:hypothetical protein
MMILSSISPEVEWNSWKSLRVKCWEFHAGACGGLKEEILVEVQEESAVKFKRISF